MIQNTQFKGTYVQTLTQHSYFRDNQVNITYLSSGSTGHHSFVIDDQGDIYAMGEGSNYQLALDNEQVAKNKENYWPMKIHFFDNMQLKIHRIACGKKFTIFISEGGATWSCGSNVFGALGWGDEISTLKQPKLIERLIKTKARGMSFDCM